MAQIKNDFPIFKNNPGLVYLDSTSTSQKPQKVIDDLKSYLENDYANIHRGAYILSERSEHMYEASKKKVAECIWATSWKEVIYTFNSNYALNLLAASFKRSHMLQKGDKVLVSIVEHHSNIVPWLILKEEIGIELEYVDVDANFQIDFEDLILKLTSNVKVVSFTHVSNVTGSVFDLERASKMVKDYSKDILFVVDASQSIPHFSVDVKSIGCDFLFFTGHKIMADTGIGVMWGKQELLQRMKVAFSWGGAISKVEKECFFDAPLPDKFEVGTPNLSGARSLLSALEYIESIGGYASMEEIENEMVSYTLEWFKKIPEAEVIGSMSPEKRVGVFSFVVKWIHSLDLAEYFAENWVCIRAGQHCAEPFLTSKNLHHTCRMSIYIYTTKEDIDRFFEVLKEWINVFKNL